MNDMTHPAIDPPGDDVLASIRRLIASGRGGDAGPAPAADPMAATGREAALQRRVAGNLRPESVTNARPLTPVPAADLLKPATDAGDGLRALALAARKSLELRRGVTPLRLSDDSRVAPPAPLPCEDGVGQRLGPQLAAMNAAGADVEADRCPPEDSAVAPQSDALPAKTTSPDECAPADSRSAAENEAARLTALAAQRARGMRGLRAPVAPDDPHLHLFAPGDADLPNGSVLRNLIREVIRQELHGEMGGRFSRNLRRVIRMEIAAALAESGDDQTCA